MVVRVGRHINIVDGFISTADHGKNTGSNIIQIFTGNPQFINSKMRDSKELQGLNKRIKELDMLIVVHAPYIINLCHPKGTKKYQDSLNALIRNMTEAHLLGALGVVIHMGKNVKEIGITEYEAMDNYVSSLKEALQKSEGIIILETGAGQGNEIGTAITDLGGIYHRLTSKEKLRVKFCIDTAHIWGAGYNIKNKEAVDTFFNLFDEEIGIDKIAIIHFNDSAVNVGSCVDRHINLGYGCIPLEGLKHVALWGKKHNVPLILETPSGKVKNYHTKKDVNYVDDLRVILKWLIK
jgi:deoxyribonuclease-4